MTKPPLILVSPNVHKRGGEFGDLALCLAETYQHALLSVGAIPVALPSTVSPEVIAECVRRSDGVLLTGGEDVEPRLYGPRLAPRLRRTVNVTPDGGQRDLRELILIDQVFRLRKPLLAICRGHQILNVALGGTLLADIRTQMPGAIHHERLDRRNEIVHNVQLTDTGLLARITGRLSLGVNSTHHQAVGRIAAPLEVIARSDDGVIECMQLKPGPDRLLPFLLSVQFHPERLVDRYDEHRAIFGAFAQACRLPRKRNL
jgi:putative glutamine amidotransferase